MDAYDTNNPGAPNPDEDYLAEHDLTAVAGGHTWPIEGLPTVSSPATKTEDNVNPPIGKGVATLPYTHGPATS